MWKFLNRPAIAISAVLAVIFVIILFRSYVTLIDDLSEAVFEVDEDNEITLIGRKESEELIKPQLLPRPKISKHISDVRITLGTFPALNGTCFLRGGNEYVFENPDYFSDLRNALMKSESWHELNKDDRSNSTKLGEILDLSFSESEKNSYNDFCSEISRYRMYSPKSEAVEELLYDMQTQPIYKIQEITDGSQFKARVVYDNEVVALFKPKRTSREQQALPNQLFFAEYERHTSEIAAYHLDRVLGFYKALPSVGRNVSMVVELLRLAEPKLQRTFFISPKPDENVCFIGNCQQFCDSYHPICGNGTFIEGSFTAFYPRINGAERDVDSHPWKSSYNHKKAATWESNSGYCNEVKMRPGYSKGRLLLELIDLSIFDFMTGNMDRYEYHRFKAFIDDTFVLNCDHGRAFGRPYHDELKILAPMLQCCMIRSSTLKTLLDIHNSEIPLSDRMMESMSEDPLAPVLWKPHLEALDRRLVIVLQAIRDCITRNTVDDVIITRDNVDFA